MIIHIPLDSRPCNVRFPAQIAAMAGAELLVPPQMDHFTLPADYSALEKFLRDSVGRAEWLVLSLDHWCFGSLLASRELGVSAGEAMSRLDALEKILREYPAVKVSAYSVIMRSSISTLNRADLPYYRLMTEYSQQWHRERLAGTREEREKLLRLAARLPAELLERYTAVRARNHAVNLRAVRMCRSGTFNKLLLLQEDAQTLGFHRIEQEALQKAAGGDERIFLHNGADESGMLLVADAVRGQEPRLKLRIAYLQGDGSFIPLFEDRPFMQNVASHCRAAGIGLTETDADCVLCVVAPKDGMQTDFVNGGDCAASASVAEDILREMRGAKPVALLDVQCVNGGDCRLLASLGRQALQSLAGYAAWNTACNSLGTVLAQLRAANGKEHAISRTFTLERLLDDGLYQGMVRRQLQTRLAENGEDVYHLSDRVGAEKTFRRLYSEALHQNGALAFPDWNVDIALPWERTFEADIRVTKVRGLTECKHMM